MRPEIIDEELLEVCGDHIAPSVDFQHNDLGPLAVLTNRELEVPTLIARGMSTKEIARRAGLTRRGIGELPLDYPSNQ